VIVEQPILPAFTRALCAAVEALRVGDPASALTQVGPVISLGRRAYLLRALDQARRSGAKVLTGGAAPAHTLSRGAWLAPTVLGALAPDAPAMREELFGPVVALVGARDLGQALEIHNDVEQGLLGALFSKDAASQARFLAEADAGILVINQARPAFADAGPFVGWKASGHGPPEHGRWNRDFYTRVQAVYGARPAA
jgi:acyl-CoA reductase-like NAD-dependent aldehyde dehydrogenase